MSLLPVLGMDPSLNNWGLAFGTYDTEARTLGIHQLDLIQPEIPTGKQVRQNSKDLARAEQLFGKALAACRGYPAVFVEVPVGSQSARAMASYGICSGVLGGLRASGVPFFEITPTEVKLVTVGEKTASKTAIINRAVERWPEAGWPLKRDGGLNMGKAEHMADAIGAIEAGLQLHAFQQTLRMWQSA